MSPTRNYLAVDLGAESGRAILGKLEDGQLSLSEMHRFPNIPVRLPDGLHWDALRLMNEVKHSIALACQAGEGRLNGIGLDTWGVDFGLLDRTGILISNPMHYRDSRTDDMMEEVFKIVPKEDIFSQTGIQFMQLNTLYQLFSLVWSNSPTLKIAETFLTMPDLFNYWLTGRKVCEFSNATTTQCYDPRRGQWAAPLLQRLSIPTEIFPEIVQPGTLLGPLATQLSEELCVPAAQVIAPACHDTGSAVAAVPAVSDSHAWISSGTWSIMGVTVDDPVISDQTLAFNLTNEGGVNGTFRLSKNIMGLWLVQECRRTWEHEGDSLSYEEITRLADAAPALRSLVDPDAREFLKPGDMPGRIQAYCRRTGQSVPDSKGAVVRCALESVALRYRWVLERLETILGRRLEVIHIVGGGTKNRLLSQLAADATGRKVVTGPVEATAAGSLLIQALGLGDVATLEDLREVVRRSFAVETFEPSDASGWDEAYRRFVDLAA